MQNNDNKEIECRFLEIDKEALVKRLCELGAEDLGEDFLEEIIFYDKELTWMYKKRTMVRIRKTKEEIFLTYKNKANEADIASDEIEFEIKNIEKATQFLEKIGLVAYRKQEKRRHKFSLKNYIIDIDTWPSVPTYVELEGTSEESLKKLASQLGFDWENVVLESPRFIIEERYGIPVSKLKYFTFDKIE